MVIILNHADLFKAVSVGIFLPDMMFYFANCRKTRHSHPKPTLTSIEFLCFTQSHPILILQGVINLQRCVYKCSCVIYQQCLLNIRPRITAEDGVDICHLFPPTTICSMFSRNIGGGFSDATFPCQHSCHGSHALCRFVGSTWGTLFLLHSIDTI